MSEVQINTDPRARTADGITWTEPPITGPPRPRRSYSRLDTYQQCPEMYFHKYVAKVPEQPSVWSAGGTAFHSVAEQYLRGDLGGHPSERDLWKTWLDAWHTAIDEVRTDVDLSKWRAAARGRENAAWWEENGYEMVVRFVRWRQSFGRDLLVFDVDGTPGLELSLEVQLGGVPVIAIPDAIVVDEHGQLCIMDYKTGKPPEKPTQLAVYRTVLHEATGFDAVWGLYYMARPGQLLARDLTKYDHAQVVDWFVEFDEAERAGFYNAQPGPSCRFCPYKKGLCSAYNEENA